MCVMFSMDLNSWNNAKSTCDSDGGRLIKIDTQEKMNDIKDIIVAGTSPHRQLLHFKNTLI